MLSTSLFNDTGGSGYNKAIVPTIIVTVQDENASTGLGR